MYAPGPDTQPNVYQAPPPRAAFRPPCAPVQAYEHARELYPETPGPLLDWRRRLGAVVAHVRQQQPDVLCLQVRPGEAAEASHTHNCSHAAVAGWA